MITSKFIWDAFEKYQDELFLIDSSESYTYKDILQKIRQQSHQKEFNHKKNQRIALVTTGSVETLVSSFALIYNGLTTVLLSDKLPKQQIDKQLESIQCENIIYPDKNTYSQNNLSIQSNSPIEAENASVIFTSGSVSIPKAILHTYSNHYYSALGSNENLPFKKDDRWLLSLPLHHIGGLSIIFRALLVGATLVGNDKTIPIEYRIEDLKVTHVSVVPTQLRRMMLYPEKLQSLKVILVGGGFVPEDLIAKAIELNLPIYKTYGLTEMSSQVTTTKQNASQAELQTSGKILNYRKIKIADDSEILVKGEVLCKKYLNSKMHIDSDGWFHTGDNGSIDSDDNLTIKGRKDNMFISGGENIYPEPIEKIIMNMDNIIEACIVPKKSNEYGEVGVLFYRTINNAEFSFDELKDYLYGKVMAYEIPKEIHLFPNEYKPLGIKINRQFLIDYFSKL